MEFYFSLLTGYYRQRLGRADSGKNSHPSLASARIPSVGPGIYQNLARFSINFNFTFPLLFEGIMSQFTRKFLSVRLTKRPTQTWECLKGY